MFESGDVAILAHSSASCLGLRGGVVFQLHPFRPVFQVLAPFNKLLLG